MPQTKKIISPAEVLDAYLKANKMRRTAERFTILEYINNIAGHFSVDELYAVLSENGYHVSMTTIYSTLEVLIGAGLVVGHRFTDKAMLYEKTGGAAASHHHLICTECGKIKEARDPELTEYISKKRYPAFEQTSFDVNIYGICSVCARRRRQAKR
jgi:Fur family ferric uptake transcriptional regulator